MSNIVIELLNVNTILETNSQISNYVDKYGLMEFSKSSIYRKLLDVYSAITELHGRNHFAYIRNGFIDELYNGTNYHIGLYPILQTMNLLGIDTPPIPNGLYKVEINYGESVGRYFQDNSGKDFTITLIPTTNTHFANYIEERYGWRA